MNRSEREETLNRENDVLKNQVDRLLTFCAESGIAYRDQYHDLIIEGFRALPDELQAEINKREEEIERNFLKEQLQE